MKPIRNGLAVLVFIALAMTAWHACAQADLFALETAYIFNFTQFTRWPVNAAHGSELDVCASSRSPLRDRLAALNGRAVGSFVWRFKALGERSPQGSPGNCDVLVLGAADDPGAMMRDTLASDSPVLIVAADETTPPGPAVIRLIQQDDHLRFDIDNTEATRRHLSLSSKLLSLARRVL